ncbi:MAG: glycosyltransferase family 2 protein [Candidatus Wallbacteria bacterium]|nr:glycosyltransferase family 2 protein [Candidatus Wallbacteria bacterium]
MLFSIITPYRDRFDKLHGYLDSLQSLVFPRKDFELILIDDGSVRDYSYNFPADFNIIRLKQEHSGQAVARNRGLSAASGRFLLFLDSDTIATPLLLSEHLNFLNRYPDSAILGNVEFPEGISPDRLTKLSDLPYFFSRLRHCQKLSFIQFMTCNLSLPSYLVISVAGFSEQFIQYGYEDIELGYRIEKKFGTSLIFNSKALVLHYHPRNLSELRMQQETLGKSQVVIQTLHPEIGHFLRLEIPDCLKAFQNGNLQKLRILRDRLESRILRPSVSDTVINQYKKLCRMSGIVNEYFSNLEGIAISHPLCRSTTAYPKHLINSESAGIHLELPDSVTEIPELSLYQINLSLRRIPSLICPVVPDSLLNRYRMLCNYWKFLPPGAETATACYISAQKSKPESRPVFFYREDGEKQYLNLRGILREVKSLQRFKVPLIGKLIFFLSFLKLPLHWYRNLRKEMPVIDSILFPLLDKWLFYIRIR